MRCRTVGSNADSSGCSMKDGFAGRSSSFPLRLPNGHSALRLRLSAQPACHRNRRLQVPPAQGDWQLDLDDSNQLSEFGWRLLRFSWEDVTERSDYVIAVVKKALSATDPQRQLQFRSSHHPESGHHGDRNAVDGSID